MKKRAKIIATVTVIAITSLIITADTTSSPGSHQNYPVSEIIEMDKAYAPTIETPSLASGEIQQISTHSENISKLVSLQNVQPQLTEKSQPTNTATHTTQTATKPTTPTPKEPTTPQMGDTRVVNGQKQSYFLGFGWIDDMGENECIFEEGMYENGNKIGIMGQSDGDINKMVGTMD